MTLQEFNNLPLVAQTDLLYEWGFFISNHIDSGVNKILFAINGFFAEEHISILTNEVLLIQAFSKNELSAEHLQTIEREKGFLLIAPGVIA